MLFRLVRRAGLPPSGTPLHWGLRRAPGWPAAVTVQLSIELAASLPASIEFTANPR